MFFKTKEALLTKLIRQVIKNNNCNIVLYYIGFKFFYFKIVPVRENLAKLTG